MGFLQNNFYYSLIVTAVFLLTVKAYCFADQEDSKADMVAIPAGEFQPLFMSNISNSDDESYIDTVSVKGFLLDRFPVTREEFLQFVKAKPQWRRSKAPKLFVDSSYLSNWNDDLDIGNELPTEAPITSVSWFAAAAYCQWRDKSLPTVNQWEYAASPAGLWPNRSKEEIQQTILEWYSKPSSSKLAPVGTTFANIWGVYDLHGLIWEWTLDFNSALVTGESRADGTLERQLFCGAGAAGSSDFEDYAGFMRYAFRSSLDATYTGKQLGFRCASESTPG